LRPEELLKEILKVKYICHIGLCIYEFVVVEVNNMSGR